MIEENSPQNSIEDFSITYGITKTVYINSALKAYAELDINKNLALFGNNNEGKTATLSGLKLSMFPETSFTKSYQKFQFTDSKGKPFTNEQSYNFFFPEYCSYIVTEAENPVGKFSMILYKSRSEWEYGRFFVPMAYKDIRHWFYQNDIDQLNEDLSFKTISGLVKKAKGIQVTDSKKIAKLIFDGYKGTPEQQRFCMIPLNNGSSTTSIEAFRNLYQLAFDIAQSDKKVLPRAIATVIEMKRGRKEERLDASLNMILSDYNKLKTESEDLNRLINSKAQWLELAEVKSKHDNLREKLAMTIANIIEIGEPQLASKQQEQQALMSEIEALTERADALKKQISSANAESGKCLGQIQSEQRNIKKFESFIKIANDEIAPYGSSRTIDEICIDIDEHISSLKTDLESYSSKSGLEDRFNKVNNEINELQLSKNNYQSILDDGLGGFLGSITPHAASVLSTLSGAFASLPSDLVSDAKESTEQFASHFTFNDDGSINFAGVKLRRMEAKVFTQLTKKDVLESMKLLDHDIQFKRKTLESIKTSIGDEAKSAEEIARIGKEIETSLAALKHIKGLETNKANITDSKEAVALLRAQHNELTEQAAALEAQLNALLVSLNNHREANNDLKRESEWLSGLIELAKRRARDFKVTVPELLNTTDYELSDSDITTLNTLPSEVDRLRNQLHLKLMTIKRHLNIGDNDDTFLSDLTEEQSEDIYQSIESAYIDLETRIKLHDESIKTHNGVVDNQVQELHEARSTVHNFITGINNNIKQLKISNLEEIKLVVKMNEAFESLMADLDKNDFTGGQLFSDGFYKRLTTFCTEFFNEKTRNIDLSMIIESIQYHYKLQGEDEFVTKSQSNATNTTSTSLLLAMLIKQISPQHYTVCLPIIVDEIASFDGANKNTAIKTIGEQGFSVFCATPTPEPAVMSGIGRWVSLNKFTIENPMVRNCHTLITPKLVENYSPSGYETVEE